MTGMLWPSCSTAAWVDWVLSACSTIVGVSYFTFAQRLEGHGCARLLILTLRGTNSMIAFTSIIVNKGFTHMPPGPTKPHRTDFVFPRRFVTIKPSVKLVVPGRGCCTPHLGTMPRSGVRNRIDVRSPPIAWDDRGVVVLAAPPCLPRHGLP